MTDPGSARPRRRALRALLALLPVGAVTGAVILVTAVHDAGGAAGPAADTHNCLTAAFPGESVTVAPTPTTAAASAFPTATPTASPSPAATVPDTPQRSMPVGWSGAWSTSLQDLEGPDLTGQTLRQIVYPTIGGSSVRIRLANTFGTRPLRLSRVSVALALHPGSPGLRPGSTHGVTFEGADDVEIPPGGRVLSDPVDLPFRFGQALAVDLVPQGPAVATSGHSRPIATSFLADGDQSGQSGQPGRFSRTVASWFWLEGIDVPDPVGTGTISMFGDSITEGAFSTVDANNRWPDLLSRRMRAHPATSGLGVANEGIGGNRVVSENLSCASPSASGLRRFERDVLSRSDVRVVVLALGINDIGSGTPATTVIDGLTELATRAHDRGLRVLAVTLTPHTCEGGCLTAEKEQQRRLVNDWIRTTAEFDAVADFDAALSDPAAPGQLLPVYDSGDHLHPSDAGMAALAGTFDLDTLLTTRP